MGGVFSAFSFIQIQHAVYHGTIAVSKALQALCIKGIAVNAVFNPVEIAYDSGCQLLRVHNIELSLMFFLYVPQLFQKNLSSVGVN